ncbi:MAG: hypothetical protein QCI82_01595 [Candidatus Thermoplasmatota archaeon]|nr:hypothetical protein [Candidatus Thermoplasmatota archaeon]
MKASSMDRLLQAERLAQQRVDGARTEASQMVNRARDDMKEHSEKLIKDEIRSKKAELAAVKERAEKESERLRKEGAIYAEEITKKGRKLVPDAVEAVVGEYLDG